jgi:histone acetyltransferase (RNA polymerase elongator complex component)
MVRKGVDKRTQIKAGQKVKKAGMELSEYVMPGLGGKDLWRDHALETADALNRINPDFIRLRTLAIPGGIPLAEEQRVPGGLSS